MRHSNEPRRIERSNGNVIPFENRATPPESLQPLLPKRQMEELRSRWDAIQTGFIDEPMAAVKDADALVTSAVKQLSEAFTDQKNQLEKQWHRGDEVSTEELRLALQRYRSFFTRLLSI
jgi:hypothetical protein